MLLKFQDVVNLPLNNGQVFIEKMIDITQTSVFLWDSEDKFATKFEFQLSMPWIPVARPAAYLFHALRAEDVMARGQMEGRTGPSSAPSASAPGAETTAREGREAVRQQQTTSDLVAKQEAAAKAALKREQRLHAAKRDKKVMSNSQALDRLAMNEQLERTNSNKKKHNVQQKQ